MAIGLIGITCGEMYHGFILASYHIPDTIGDVAFFDMILSFILLLTVLEMLQKGKAALYSFSHHSRNRIKLEANDVHPIKAHK